MLSAAILALLGASGAQAAGLVCKPEHLITISVGPGPEDMAWDEKHSRLLISSAVRPGAGKGSIQALQIPLGEVGVSPRTFVTDLEIDRPTERKPFYPVGISLLRTELETLLYVVVSGGGARGHHAIEKFRVEQNRLSSWKPSKASCL